MDDEAPVAEEAAVGAQIEAIDTGSGARWRSVSGSRNQTMRQRRSAEAEQRHEIRAPAERGLQHAADQRRDQRRQRHDRRHARQLAADAARPRTCRARSARASTLAPEPPSAWTNARGDQRLDGRRQRAGQRRHADRCRARRAAPAAGRGGRTAARRTPARRQSRPDRPRSSAAPATSAHRASGRSTAATPDTCRPTAGRARSAWRAAAVSARGAGTRAFRGMTSAAARSAGAVGMP